MPEGLALLFRQLPEPLPSFTEPMSEKASAAMSLETPETPFSGWDILEALLDLGIKSCHIATSVWLNLLDMSCEPRDGVQPDFGIGFGIVQG